MICLEVKFLKKLPDSVKGLESGIRPLERSGIGLDVCDDCLAVSDEYHARFAVFHEGVEEAALDQGTNARIGRVISAMHEIWGMNAKALESSVADVVTFVVYCDIVESRQLEVDDFLVPLGSDPVFECYLTDSSLEEIIANGYFDASDDHDRLVEFLGGCLEHAREIGCAAWVNIKMGSDLV